MANYLVPSRGRPIPLASTTSKKDLIHVDPMYKIRVYNRPTDTKQLIDVNGYVPEDFAINLMAMWEEPFEGTFNNLSEKVEQNVPGATGKVASTVMKAAGLNNQVAGSARTWSSGTYLQFDLPLKVSAYDNTKNEVMEPLKKVLKLCTPSLGPGGILLPPGPTFLDFVTIAKSAFTATDTATAWQNALLGALQNDAIYLEVGSFFRMFPCVVTNVTANFNGMFEHGTGFPTSVEFNLSLESYLTPTAFDIDNWILT